MITAWKKGEVDNEAENIATIIMMVVIVVIRRGRRTEKSSGRENLKLLLALIN